MQKSFIPAQRRKEIQEYLTTHRAARLADLSTMLNASEATIRRDLEKLEEIGFLERTHGGAVLSQRLSREPEYKERLLDNPDLKRIIGQFATTFIEDGDVVFINGGTTATEIIRHIPPNANITVITNNLIAALEIDHIGYELILLGGIYQPTSHSVGGYFSNENLKQVYADKTFIGVDGISLKYGCTFPTSAEAEVVRTMMGRTRGPVYVVADNNKWGTVSNYQVAEIEKIHRLITDAGLDIPARESLAEQSVEVLIAGDDVDR
ncbi:MAG: DeoR/GlpR transcriptional regulator [Anaerolineae bacterium]|jgi:DeoR family transcriptional regulator of aga operon|nr:DeoR/GlpR transcriptional regulator [Anaerolineae bacterium]MBT3714292.1 DeoR/GlpR transcriptional regulator [Anaerolineae bacterium]MBT4310163.1 DeoR/GlpR transcriptional regulator [Anaerolineae bacterium]MBT4459485.1 DeoR/GlpR transcriptional regulator [Anaerolineae bacterium]MBT6063097.1 DeoR/GlpR transcriptional regulator [Anaerolineae bacterium]